MKTETDYRRLADKLVAIEEKTGLYLHDFNVDAENSESHARDSDEWWDLMYAQMCSSAGMRAEMKGHDINALVGSSIY